MKFTTEPTLDMSLQYLWKVKKPNLLKNYKCYN